MEAEAKFDYKRTEVGLIPADWDVAALHTLGVGGVPPVKAGPFGSAITKDTYVRRGYKVYGQEQVIRGDHEFGDYYIDEAKYRELSSYRVAPGDILFSLVGTLGKTLVVPDDAAEGVINPRLLRLSLDSERINPQFLKRLFESKHFQSILARYAQGGTMGILNARILRSVQIPLPPLPEQRAIADALSDVDALIERLDALIAKKRAIKTAAMQRLLTGQERLPGFSAPWTTRRLGEVCRKIVDGTHYTPTYVQDGIPFYSVENVSANNFTDVKYISEEEHRRLVKRCKPEKDDILMTRIGSLGQTKLIDWEIEASIYVSLALLKVEESLADPEYLYSYTQSNAFVREVEQRALVNASPKKINMSAIGKVPILLPPQEEQRAIADILTDMDAEIEALQARRDKTQAIKQGMMQELLTGRTRLV